MSRNSPGLPVAIGVPCVDLETWFLLSDPARTALGIEPFALRDPQQECDDETADIATAGCTKLELLVQRYDSVKARRGAEAIVSSKQSIEALAHRSASFRDFVAEVRSLYAPAAKHGGRRAARVR